MVTREELESHISLAKRDLANAETNLAEWMAQPENNVFPTLADAESAIEDALLDEAAADCEGAHNCGADRYTREFMVGTTVYVGTLTVEYNRHDKTYYYVDGHEFSSAEKVPA